jgi:GST-like protein
MEVKRQLDVLDKLLSDKTYICNEEYTIADIAIWSWYGALVLGRLYGAEEFLDVKSYKNVVKWANLINERPAVKRGRIVNKISGNLDEQLHERHDSNDFNKKTEDKLVK